MKVNKLFKLLMLQDADVQEVQPQNHHIIYNGSSFTRPSSLAVVRVPNSFVAEIKRVDRFQDIH